MTAGGSARARASRAREYALELWRGYREAYELAGRYAAAAEAERKVAAVLISLTRGGWRLLVDRRWPGTRSANVDMILVGPPGVFVIDVKCWRPKPAVVDGHLVAGEFARDDDIGRILGMARTAEQHVASLGLTPIAVRPLLVFTGHRLNTRLGRARLLGDHDVVNALLAEPGGVPPAMVKAVARHLEEVFPAYDAPMLGGGTKGPVQGTLADTDPLFDVAEMQEATLRSILAAPVERWMTFLHPEQVALTRRNWNGPARISGPAGTGKTVVGLHRAAYLAERTTGRCLYVTYVNSLPRVQAQLFRRLSPATADRVEFAGLHAWAQAFLADRGIRVSLNGDRAETAFSLAWARAGKDSALMDIDPSPRYWREEIDHVIKGRGVTTLEEYRSIPRHGRRTALQTAHREAAWLLYEEYELLLTERGVQDFNDILLAALKEVTARPLDRPYATVIVDEVQDLTLVGIRLLHALAGDGPNRLLLIGDGQQAVYPGGFRLSEAGISVKGRGGVLRTNYRNASQILDAALDLVSGDSFDDIEETGASGRRDVEATYHDGRVVRVTAPDEAEHDRLLVEALRELPDLGGAAVLCVSLRELDDYQRVLRQAGVPVVRLEHYDGHEVEAVKIGTYRRAKGLDFKYVFLPHHDALSRQGAPSRQGTPSHRGALSHQDALSHRGALSHQDAAAGGDRAAERERAEISRRQLFVAMTRARDLLWLGSVASEKDAKS
jgi:superfamily I DNA/RNA helicase